MSPSSALGPPHLRLAGQTATTIALAWTDPNPSDAGSELQRAVGLGAYVTLARPAKHVLGWTDTALPVAITAPITVTYRVRARGPHSVSAWSNLVATIITIGQVGQPPPPPPGGCTVTATGLSSAEVQAAITACPTNGTVCLPAGTGQWTTAITCTRAIVIQGAGQGVTIIQDNMTSGTGLTWNVPANTTTSRLTGMTFAPLGTHSLTTGMLRVVGDLTANAYTAFRLDNITCQDWVNANRPCFAFFDNVYGCIDHVTWTGQTNEFLDVRHTSYQGVGAFGDKSWASPKNFGTQYFLFIEDSTFTNTNPSTSAPVQSIVEGDGGGGRFVFRHNPSVVQYRAGGHGTESPGRNRGLRVREIYENHFVATAAADSWVQIRSGTGLIYHNTMTMNAHSLNGICKLWLERATDTNFWGYYDDTGTWDSNSGVIYESGTATAGTGTEHLFDSSKSWTANQWVGYTLRDTTAGKSSYITANGVSDLTTAAPTQSGTHTYAVGDSYQIRLPLIAIDQPCRGQSDLADDASNPPTFGGVQRFPNNISEPVRIWGNTGTTNANKVTQTTISLMVTDGVDYFTSADDSMAEPGYTAYTYPHPLNDGAHP